MLITIDGHGGAGKTTQVTKLVKLLEAHRVKAGCFQKLRYLRSEITKDPNLSSKGDIYFLFDLLYRVIRSSSNKFFSESIFVSDEFWLILWERGSNQRYFEYLQDFVPFPDVSFYINIPARESYIRTTIRDKKPHDLSSIALDKLSKKFTQKDKQANEFWSWLSKRVSNLHIIDGTLPEEKVTDTMLSILGEHYGIKINSDL